jgi:hypothetical protein
MRLVDTRKLQQKRETREKMHLDSKMLRKGELIIPTLLQQEVRGQ